ncbi:hypothetical protein INT47_010798 [Mucor saturninus]|uniref:Uncharacterized protein n=1 Tax=Mucor saturninus TaxID=64648 RepID=A0A8H7QRF7_9FUNG|nr:hypothetical protein INT47_010798 [Mucor saturninus]
MLSSTSIALHVPCLCYRYTGTHRRRRSSSNNNNNNKKQQYIDTDETPDLLDDAMQSASRIKSENENNEEAMDLN